MIFLGLIDYNKQKLKTINTDGLTHIERVLFYPLFADMSQRKFSSLDKCH